MWWESEGGVEGVSGPSPDQSEAFVDVFVDVLTTTQANASLSRAELQIDCGGNSSLEESSARRKMTPLNRKRRNIF